MESDLHYQQSICTSQEAIGGSSAEKPLSQILS